ISANDSTAGADNQFISKVQLLVDGTLFAEQAYSTNLLRVTWSVPLSALAVGSHTLTANAYGACSRMASVSIPITVTGSAIAVTGNTASALSATKGAAAPSGIVTYTNSGNIAVTLNLTGVSAPYSLSASTCLVNPASTCSVTVSMATSGAIGAQGAQTLTATG